MPLPRRADGGGEIYHVLNRGNGRATIFHKDADYEAFERVLDAFGDAGWVETTARHCNLESTLRSRGRPRKFTQAAK
jgi:hypothetical protein